MDPLKNENNEPLSHQTWTINKMNRIVCQPEQQDYQKNSNYGTNLNYNNRSYNYNNQWKTKKKTENNRYSAGILPYSYDPDGNCLFLLGKDYSGDWSDFGGRCEHIDNNNEINTASREFYEETLGSVITNTECIHKLKNGNPVKIISKTLNGSPYYMYLLYIDYENYSDIFNKMLNFIKYNSSKNNNFINKSIINESKLVEKISIKWISIDTIIASIGNIKPSFIPLREVFLNTLKLSKDQILFISKV